MSCEETLLRPPAQLAYSPDQTAEAAVSYKEGRNRRDGNPPAMAQYGVWLCFVACIYGVVGKSP